MILPSEVIHMRFIRFPFAFSSTECPAAVHLFKSEAEDIVAGCPKAKTSFHQAISSKLVMFYTHIKLKITTRK